MNRLLYPCLFVCSLSSSVFALDCRDLVIDQGTIRFLESLKYIGQSKIDFAPGVNSAREVQLRGKAKGNEIKSSQKKTNQPLLAPPLMRQGVYGFYIDVSVPQLMRSLQEAALVSREVRVERERSEPIVASMLSGFFQINNSGQDMVALLSQPVGSLQIPLLHQVRIMFSPNILNSRQFVFSDHPFEQSIAVGNSYKIESDSVRPANEILSAFQGVVEVATVFMPVERIPFESHLVEIISSEDTFVQIKGQAQRLGIDLKKWPLRVGLPSEFTRADLKSYQKDPRLVSQLPEGQDPRSRDLQERIRFLSEKKAP